MKDIGGDKHLMAPEVQETLRALRDGFSLFYEMYALLEGKVRQQPLPTVPEKEQQAFFGTYAMFAAGSFITHELNLAAGEQKPFELKKRENYFTFDGTKDDTLNLVLARFYGLVNTGKRDKIIVSNHKI